MRLRCVVAQVSIISMVFASTAVAATAPPMARTLNCVSAKTNPRITATVPSTLSSPRVFFRANGERNEYYVDMHRSASNPNEWFAVLPSIEPSTKTITYRVAAVDDNKNWIVSAPITVSAASVCAGMLSSDEMSMASGIVLGLTTAGQSDVPPGFSCRGIVNVIGVDCQMRPADGCRRLLAGGLTGVPAAVGAALAGAGLSAAAIAALAGIGVLTGIAIYNNNNHNKEVVSPSRP